MPKTARRVCVVVLGAVLTVALALPAWAGRIISYRGETSQGKRVSLEILKRDSGRRFLREFIIYFTETCEDGSGTSLSGVGFNEYRRGLRLDANGEFRIDHEPQDPFSIHAYHAVGMVEFGSADGTFELRLANLNEAEEPQLCTTGLVDWSAERQASRPTRVFNSSLDEGVTLFRGRPGR